ncbi:TPA: class I SAM-dependent methyltransferase [Candidatus Woesearchaeota archaeon]|nr:class I SAM-dependent methyltransferase [Candidatus Woesearchaeota archaeon]
MKQEVYPDILLENYDLVLHAYPQLFRLREEVAEILHIHFRDSERILIEIGCGAGATTEYILRQNPKLKIIAIDRDQRMIDRLKENLPEFVKTRRLIPLTIDIFKYILTLDDSSIDGIASSWTIHNFSQKQRTKLLHAIYRVLKPNGIFVNMDKYVLDNPQDEQRSFDEVVKRLKEIPQPEVAAAAIQHEQEDREVDIIMKEKESLSEMAKMGFKNVQIHIRIGREVVVSCLK